MLFATDTHFIRYNFKSLRLNHILIEANYSQEELDDNIARGAMNPAQAPTSIIPSTPRLVTPARSEISSPSAANKIGVPAVIEAAKIEMSNVSFTLFASFIFDQAQLIIGKDISADDKE